MSSTRTTYLESKRLTVVRRQHAQVIIGFISCLEFYVYTGLEAAGGEQGSDTPYGLAPPNISVTYLLVQPEYSIRTNSGR
jgi:hypothetical protein